MRKKAVPQRGSKKLSISLPHVIVQEVEKRRQGRGVSRTIADLLQRLFVLEEMAKR